MFRNVMKSAACVLVLGLVAAAQTIPAGTRITVRIGSQINSGTAQVGKKFQANFTMTYFFEK